MIEKIKHFDFTDWLLVAVIGIVVIGLVWAIFFSERDDDDNDGDLTNTNISNMNSIISSSAISSNISSII